MKKWFDLDTGELKTGTERQYWAYKIDMLIKRQDNLSEEYFDDTLLHLLEAYTDAFNREMGYNE